MTVYVDNLRACIPNKNWKWTESCHMWADDLEELHAFALKIGMKRAWFQDHPKLAHYDLTKGRRAKAIRLGAKEMARPPLKRN